jgi:thioredoxin-like negative regulator of GroEL
MTDQPLIAALRAIEAARNDGQDGEARRLLGEALATWPDDARVLRLAAFSALAEGDRGAALGHLERAHALSPADAALTAELAELQLRRGAPEAARPLFALLAAAAPDDVRWPLGLARCDWRAGRYEAALAGFTAAAARRDARALLARARALLMLDRLEEARTALARLPEVVPDAALIQLGVVMSRAQLADLGLEVDRVARFAERDASCALALGVVRHLMGHAEAAAPLLAAARSAPRLAPQVAAFEAAMAEAPDAEVFGAPTKVMRHALRRAPAGLRLELGVEWGRSLRLLAALDAAPWHGFDSFEGLPEAFGPDAPRGAQSTGGMLPTVPGGVTLHRGWFADALPRFLAEHDGPVGFVHFDCELHSSTQQALDLLGPRLAPDAVLLFDDWSDSAAAVSPAQRAFREWAAAHGRGHRLLAVHGWGRPVALRLA